MADGFNMSTLYHEDEAASQEQEGPAAEQATAAAAAESAAAGHTGHATGIAAGAAGVANSYYPMLPSASPLHGDVWPTTHHAAPSHMIPMSSADPIPHDMFGPLSHVTPDAIVAEFEAHQAAPSPPGPSSGPEHTPSVDSVPIQQPVQQVGLPPVLPQLPSQAPASGIVGLPNSPTEGVSSAGGASSASGAGAGVVPQHTQTQEYSHTYSHEYSYSFSSSSFGMSSHTTTHTHMHGHVLHHHPGHHAEALGQVPASILASGPIQSISSVYNAMSQFYLLAPSSSPALANDNSVTPHNAGLRDFLKSYARRLVHTGYPRANKILTRSQITAQMDSPRRYITQDKIDGDRCDIQGVDWTQLGIPRQTARTERMEHFQLYPSMLQPGHRKSVEGQKVPSSREEYFLFRRMHVKTGMFLPHFQLRNLLTCSSRTRAYYTDRGGIVQEFNPLTGLNKPIMRFQGKSNVVLSTIASGQNMLVAGGFVGEYCVTNLASDYVDDTPFGNCFQGTADSIGDNGSGTEDSTSHIINHIEVHSLRNAAGPLATLSSNDSGLRTLDLETQKMLSTIKFDFAPNCTAISPDQRLRVVVGDRPNALVVAAEPERSVGTVGGSKAPDILQVLGGHKDFGFSCAWAPDGYTLATGNQDCTIKIWDARSWSTPVTTMRTQMSNARSLHFTPAGSGCRLLVVGEEADLVTTIDALSFRSQQTMDMFGEMGGVALTDDGQDLFVLCTDPCRGGIAQFERVNASKHVDDDHLDEAFRPYSWRQSHQKSTLPPDWTPIGTGNSQGGSATAATVADVARKAQRQRLSRLARRRHRAASRSSLDSI